jgi:hypothetical protein
MPCSDSESPSAFPSPCANESGVQALASMLALAPIQFFVLLPVLARELTKIVSTNVLQLGPCANERGFQATVSMLALAPIQFVLHPGSARAQMTATRAQTKPLPSTGFHVGVITNPSLGPCASESAVYVLCSQGQCDSPFMEGIGKLFSTRSIIIFLLKVASAGLQYRLTGEIVRRNSETLMAF